MVKYKKSENKKIANYFIISDLIVITYRYFA